MSTQPDSQDTLTVTPLHPALGAEIRGVDFTARVPTETVARIVDAWSQYLVLVFPDQAPVSYTHLTLPTIYSV